MKPTVLDLPSYKSGHEKIAQEGDVLIVLSRNGDSKIVTVGVERDEIMNKVKNRVDLSETEEADLDTSHKAFCLLMAAGNEQIMSILEDLASNPEVIDPTKLANLRMVN